MSWKAKRTRWYHWSCSNTACRYDDGRCTSGKNRRLTIEAHCARFGHDAATIETWETPRLPGDPPPPRGRRARTTPTQPQPQLEAVRTDVGVISSA